MLIGDMRRGKDGHLEMYHACVICSKPRWVAVRHGLPRNLLCTAHTQKNHTLDHNPHWKGGRRIRRDGYTWVKLPPDDPCMAMAMVDGYIQEHRVLMAKHLGRLLVETEIVHHKNGVVDDNRIENLELLPTNGSHCSLHHLLRGHMVRKEG